MLPNSQRFILEQDRACMYCIGCMHEIQTPQHKLDRYVDQYFVWFDQTVLYSSLLHL